MALLMSQKIKTKVKQAHSICFKKKKVQAPLNDKRNNQIKIYDDYKLEWTYSQNI